MPKSDGYKNLKLGSGWNKGQSNKIEYICPVCGKVFLKKVYKKVQAVYCSQKCAYIGRSMGFTKRKIETPYSVDRSPREWRYRVCLFCQTEYVATKRTQKYCSKECCDTHKKITSLGENNPSYKNGSSYEKRSWRGNDWETLRQEIYKRDNYTCQKCGVKCLGKRDYRQDSSRIIQCHHIENYKIDNNNKNQNLITLCLKCHLKTHYGTN